MSQISSGRSNADVQVLVANSLVPVEYDEVDLTPASLPTTVTFKKAGVTVRTLTLAYSGTDLQSVVAS